MRIIVINRSDGGVSIMKIYDNSVTAKEILRKWELSNQSRPSDDSMKDVKTITFNVIQESDTPTDRTNRDAWTWQ